MANGFGSGLGGQSLLGGLLQPIGNIAQQFNGLSMISQGAAIQQAGFRSSQIGINNTAAFNESVVNFNLKRDLADLGRQIMQTASTQRVQAAASGTAGKSALLVMSETLSVFELGAQRLKNNAEIERNQIRYAAQLRNIEIQNQANFAAFQASQQKSQAIGGIFSQIGSLFGGF